MICRGSSFLLMTFCFSMHLITCLKDFQHVQNDIDELCNWLSSHKLSLNPNKWKVLLISRKIFPTVSPTFHVNEPVLERVSSTDVLESLFPLTSLGLTILRTSAPNHVNRLDYYTVIFISMLHHQP